MWGVLACGTPHVQSQGGTPCLFKRVLPHMLQHTESVWDQGPLAQFACSTRFSTDPCPHEGVSTYYIVWYQVLYSSTAGTLLLLSIRQRTRTWIISLVLSQVV